MDLQSLTDEELEAVWTAWLYQARITNDEDRYTCSHGVFIREPVDETASESSEKMDRSP